MPAALQCVFAAVVLAISAAAIAVSVAFFWVLIAALGVVALAGVARKRYNNWIFSCERKTAKEAVESLQFLIHAYDHDDVIGYKQSAKHGPDFALALANARLYADNMDEWIMMIGGCFYRGCLPHRGLAISQVPAMVDLVRSELIGCYCWFRDGKPGQRPAILSNDWYEVERVFPDYREIYSNFRPRQNQPPKLAVVAVTAAVGESQCADGTMPTLVARRANTASALAVAAGQPLAHSSVVTSLEEYRNRRKDKDPRSL